MRLSFYDVAPSRNDYLTIMYFKELRKFCVDRDLPIEDILDLMAVKNSTVLINASWLERGVITRLKENNNIIIAFDINDQAYFTEWIPEDEILYIDLIFKIAGLQKTEESYEIIIDDDMNYGRKKQKFRDGNWGKYFEMINADKIRSLPYPPWNSIIADNISWEDRNKLVLIRGGHQYLRVHLYLQLLKNGLIDRNSTFSSFMYTHQYCDGCKQIYKDHGKITYANLTDTPCRLYQWIPGDNHWNNSCISRYLDMARIFNDKYGGMDFDLIEKAFDGRWLDDSWFNTILNRYLFYADFKWVFSIYAPSRFWEAAGAGTINLVPERTNDQELFPKIKENIHYITFKEDFSNIGDVVKNLTQEQFESITHNCLELYNTWIKPEKYRVAENLLQHIVDEIFNVKERNNGRHA